MTNPTIHNLCDVLLVMKDLIFLSRIQLSANKLNLKTQTASPTNGSTVSTAILTHQPRLVIFDLETALPLLDEAVTTCKSFKPPVRTIAFGPHVDEQSAKVAENAGVDQVMPRSRFNTQLDAIFSELAKSF